MNMVSSPLFAHSSLALSWTKSFFAFALFFRRPFLLPIATLSVSDQSPASVPHSALRPDRKFLVQFGANIGCKWAGPKADDFRRRRAQFVLAEKGQDGHAVKACSLAVGAVLAQSKEEQAQILEE